MCKQLRVFLDDDLSFKTHIFSFVKNTKQKCNLLLYAFSSLNNSILISLFKVFVRSFLDTDSILYSPCYMYLIALLENVQQKLLKRCLVHATLIILNA